MSNEWQNDVLLYLEEDENDEAIRLKMFAPKTQWQPVDVPIICACDDPRCQITLTPVGNSLEIDVPGTPKMTMHLPGKVRLMICR